MLRNFMIVLGTLIVIIVICGYLIYANRSKLIHKVVDYTMQSMLSGKNATQISDKDDEQTWVGALFGAGSENLKYAVAEIMNERGVVPIGNKNQTRQQLATVADMFMNGTSDNNNDNVKQLANMFVASFGNGKNKNNSNPVEHDINARDDKGRTLLMNVCRVDVTPKVIKMLIRYGADIHAVDDNGRTALMYASGLNQNLDVVKLLVESGINASAMDYSGKTAYDYAEDIKIRKYLHPFVAQ